MTTNWKSNEVIRNKESGKPYLVLHVYKNICTIVVNLDDRAPSIPLVLLERDYNNFASDREMKQSVKEDYNVIEEKWEYTPETYESN